LTEREYCDKVLMFEAAQTDTGKQSIHSHPMAIRLIGVYIFDFILVCFCAYIG